MSVLVLKLTLDDVMVSLWLLFTRRLLLWYNPSNYQTAFFSLGKFLAHTRVLAWIRLQFTIDGRCAKNGLLEGRKLL